MALMQLRPGEPKKHIHCPENNNATKLGSEHVTSYDKTYSSNWDDTDSSYDSDDDYPIAWWELDDIAYSLAEPLQQLQENFNDERRAYRWKLDKSISRGAVESRIVLDIESHASIVKERTSSYLRGRNPSYVKLKKTKNARASLDNIGNQKGSHSTSSSLDRRDRVYVGGREAKDSKKSIYAEISVSLIKAREEVQELHPKCKFEICRRTCGRTQLHQAAVEISK